MSTANYRLGHHEVEARRHDGTDESAEALASWVRSHAGRVDIIPKGQFEWDRNFAFLRLHNRYDRLVQPNFWVVKTSDDHFYSVYPDIFKNMYKPIKEVTDDTVEATPSIRGSAPA